MSYSWVRVSHLWAKQTVHAPPRMTQEAGSRRAIFPLHPLQLIWNWSPIKPEGHYCQITTPQVSDALETSLQEMVSDGYIYWSPVTGSVTEDSPVTISIDETITQTGFLLNTFTGINTLKVVRPNGSVVAEGDEGNRIPL